MFCHSVPNAASTLVVDMSSTILSRPVDVTKFGVIYAGAQKNIGPAGLTVVIVRDDLLGHARPDTPTVLDYAAMAKEGSMLNTPPTYTWYVAGLVFQWLKRQGGLAAMGALNRAKAEKIYAAIDASSSRPSRIVVSRTRQRRRVLSRPSSALPAARAASAS